jgi:hypothetical protein
MKKIILAACLLIGTAGYVAAQQGQGGGFNNPERLAQMKQTYKDSVGLTDAQAQQVLDVQMEFRPKMMELRNVAEADRPAKIKELNDQMEKRLAEVLKDEALAKKVAAFNARNRMNRGAGNRPQRQ